MSNEITGTLHNYSLSGTLNRQGGGTGGSSNYNDLINKPSINGTSLIGDKSLDELNIASKDYVEQEIATFDFIKIVQELPVEGLPNRTYLVTKENSTENDLYDEYIWVNKGSEEEPNYEYEYLGTKKIEVDLTNYATKDYVDNAISNAGGGGTQLYMHTLGVFSGPPVVVICTRATPITDFSSTMYMFLNTSALKVSDPIAGTILIFSYVSSDETNKRTTLRGVYASSDGTLKTKNITFTRTDTVSKY